MFASRRVESSPQCRGLFYRDFSFHIKRNAGKGLNIFLNITPLQNNDIKLPDSNVFVMIASTLLKVYLYILFLIKKHYNNIIAKKIKRQN